jgi:hypothetical protein
MLEARPARDQFSTGDSVLGRLWSCNSPKSPPGFQSTASDGTLKIPRHCQASTPVTVPPDNPFLEHSLVAHVPSHELPSLPQKFHEAWTLLVGFRPHWLFRFMQTRGRASSRHRRPSTRGSHAFLVRRRPEMASYFVCTPRCFLLRQGSVLKNSGSQVMMPAPDCSLAELGNLRLCALDA